MNNYNNNFNLKLFLPIIVCRYALYLAYKMNLLFDLGSYEAIIVKIIFEVHIRGLHW